MARWCSTTAANELKLRALAFFVAILGRLPCSHLLFVAFRLQVSIIGHLTRYQLTSFIACPNRPDLFYAVLSCHITHLITSLMCVLFAVFSQSTLTSRSQGLRLLSAGTDRAFRVFSTIQDQQSRELSQKHTAKRAKKLKVRGHVVRSQAPCHLLCLYVVCISTNQADSTGSASWRSRAS